MPSSPRSGPDGCPGTLQLHAAADGGLARVRIPGGILTAQRLTVLADAAADLGDGCLELTSRANVQIRALASGAERELTDRLRAAGLLPSDTHERVRNIVASVLTGRDDQGLLDVRPLLGDLDRGICADPALAELPGRFLFTIDDGRGDVTALRGDVGLFAVSPDEMALLLGGRDSGVRVSPAEAVALALTVARAFLDVRDGEWRIAELPDPSLIIDGLLRIAGLSDEEARDSREVPSDRGVSQESSAAPRTPLGVIAQRNGRVAVSRSAARRTPVEEIAGRLTSLRLITGHGRERVARNAARRTPLGVIAQCDGRVAVSGLVPLGRLDVESAARLASAAEVIITPWRGVVVPDLAEPADYGLVTEPGSAWAGLTTCAGRPGCAKSLTDVRADAAAAREAVPGLPVHWSGCERRCGSPTDRHVAVVATPQGYQVRVDGTPQEPDATTTREKTPETPTPENSAARGSTPGSTTAESTTTRGTAAGGTTAEGSVTGSTTAEGSVTGSTTAEGSVTGSTVAGGSAPWGSAPWGSAPWGSARGSTTAGGTTAESTTTRGSAAESTTAEGSVTGGSVTGGSVTGGSVAGGSARGSTTAGGAVAGGAVAGGAVAGESVGGESVGGGLVGGVGWVRWAVLVARRGG